MTTIGKEGMYMSEQKLRSQITLRYVFDLLSTPDTMTDCLIQEGENLYNESDESSENENEEQVGLINSKKVGKKIVRVNEEQKDDQDS